MTSDGEMGGIATANCATRIGLLPHYYYEHVYVAIESYNTALRNTLKECTECNNGEDGEIPVLRQISGDVM